MPSSVTEHNLWISMEIQFSVSPHIHNLTLGSPVLEHYSHFLSTEVLVQLIFSDYTNSLTLLLFWLSVAAYIRFKTWMLVKKAINEPVLRELFKPHVPSGPLPLLGFIHHFSVLAPQGLGRPLLDVRAATSLDIQFFCQASLQR